MYFPRFGESGLIFFYFLIILNFMSVHLSITKGHGCLIYITASLLWDRERSVAERKQRCHRGLRIPTFLSWRLWSQNLNATISLHRVTVCNFYFFLWAYLYILITNNKHALLFKYVKKNTEKPFFEGRNMLQYMTWIWINNKIYDAWTHYNQCHKGQTRGNVITNTGQELLDLSV